MTNKSIVDERTLREIYLSAFEFAIQDARPWTVMCSSNQINGRFSPESPLLLKTILKEQRRFAGFVMSDWGAVSNRIAGINAGPHQEMPSSLDVTDKEIVAATRTGTLNETRLDEVVTDFLAVIVRAHKSRTEPVA